MKGGAGHHARLLTAALRGAGGGTAPAPAPAPAPETTSRRVLSTNTRPLQAASIPTWLQQAYKIFSYTIKGPRFIVSSKSFSTIGSVMAMTTGIGLIAVNSDIALAESNQEDACNDNTMDPSSEKSAEIEQLVKTERMKLDECLRKLENQLIIPPFTVTAKGQQVAIRFQLPTDCELSLLVVDVVSYLGLKNDSSGGSSEMILRAWDSTVARQFLLMHPKQSCLGEKANQTRDCEADDDSLCIVFFQPLIGSDNPEVEFLKKGSFSMNELDALINALRKSLATRHQRRPAQDKHHDFSPAGDVQNPGSLISNSKTIKSLEEMGVKIYGLNANDRSSAKNDISWDNLAGYHEQKREIEDTVLLALRCPEIYDNIAKATRHKFESNRPRAVLFEGPPGTGKTSCARVIASQAGVPLLYVPLEVVMSKYYGESERLLGSIFSLANELPDGAIVFLDEIDSFAVARNSEMHEATRRILSVLLRQIDGFDQEKKVVVIGATNRTQDLDPALISRFDSLITFDLPDEQTREEIAAQYAKHLSAKELATFARATEGMAGRDLRDICQQAERNWASKLIRGQVNNQLTNSLPPLHEYVDSAKKRQKSVFGNKAFCEDQRQIASPTKKWPSVLT